MDLDKNNILNKQKLILKDQTAKVNQVLQMQTRQIWLTL